jgi:release factor glutamine methyltransferase
VTQAGGFRLTVRPAVFHPRFFITSEFFASFIEQFDLTGKRVADVGPDQAPYGVEHRVTTVCSNLLSALAPSEPFDVIISNPPFLPGEPRDLADRAWYAGANYRNIAPLFDQARERLALDGRVHILVSSDSDPAVISRLIVKAHLKVRLIAKRSILIESFLIYELRATVPTTSFSRRRADYLEPVE